MKDKIALYEAKNLSLTQIDYLGEMMVASGRFQTVKDKAQAIVQILAGQELGYSPLVAMTKIHIIEGKISISAELMAAMIKRSSYYDYKVIKHTKQECSIQFYHNGENGYLSTFTIDDAKAAGVFKPGSGWMKFPRAMLFSRALSQGARIECPHLLNGIYTSEELGAIIDETGNTISIPDENQYISSEQFAILNEWIEKSEANEENFLKFMNVESLETIPAEKYDSALNALKEKAQKAGKK